MPSARRAGLVVLVGAGPGEESLLTLAAVQWLSLADTIVYDRLANAAVLRRCRKDAVRVYVGKTPGKEGHDQASINRLLVERARAGELVVRLKGGDPFIFGRGGEEASALVEAGVPYRVVPGITAALAAGAYAGMPLTDRRVASTVALVTGQEDTGKPESNIDWRALAGIDTVVMYMGIRNLGQIAANLISGGRSPQTPAALVANASTPRQKTILATLGTLAAEARKAGLEPPAVAIIGAVAGLREKLAWFEHLPLFGQRVIVTRPAQQASEFSVAQVPNLCHALAEMGAAVIEAPSIEIRPVEDFSGVDGAVRRLDRFDIVVFTSPNGVEAFAARCRQLGLDGRALGKSKVAAIGATTASALRGLFIQADTMPAEFTTEALADALLAAGVSRKRILLARADIAGELLARRLRQAGAVVEDVAFYRTCRPSALPEDALAALKAGKVDWLTFTSSSSVENFLALLASAGLDVSLLRPCKLAAIGPVTARTLANHGLPPAVTATEHTLAGLLRAMVEPK